MSLSKRFSRHPFPRFAAVAVFLFGLLLHLPAVEIIAHRGASHDAPENTLPSFRLGWEQGADADELDIYLTKDGQVVVIHDANTKRTTGVDAKVPDTSMADLRAMDAGAWKGAQWKGTKLPLLSEVLALIPDGRKLFIEIKCGPEVLPALEKVLQQCGRKPQQTIIIGFSYEVVKQAKELFPDRAVYWLASWKADKATGKYPELDDLIAKAKAAKLDGLDLDFKFPIDAAFVSKITAEGMKLFTWTVDDPAVAKKLAAAGVHGVTTNRPGWLREQLR